MNILRQANIFNEIKSMMIKNKKPIIIGLGITIILAVTGTVLGLNGFFGGAPLEI